MKILITGATGLIGKELGKELSLKGHELVVISRNAQKAREELPYLAEIIEHDLGRSPLHNKLFDIDAVFHLAGEGVANQRWNTKIKAEILKSRIVGTENLIASLGGKVNSFISGSAIGYYGSCLDQELTEESPAGNDFLAHVCKKWEIEALKSTAERVILVRTGVVLSEKGGALAKMLFPFRAGVGGALGDGKNWMSWIHLTDMVRLLVFLLETESIKGVVNAVSPDPVQNKKFSQTLATVLKRPLGPSVPKFALKALYGEMSEVLLASQRVIPSKLLKSGFQFEYTELASTLSEILKGEASGEDIFLAEQFIKLPPEEVFPFFSEAKNLEEITPKFLNFKVKKVSSSVMSEGTVIDYTLKIHGVPVGWKTLIAEWKPPFSFIDNQVKGPYKKWHHTHSFKAVPGGTLMTDRVRFCLPMGYLGWVVAQHFVKKDVKTIFAYRRQKVASLFSL